MTPLLARFWLKRFAVLVLIILPTLGLLEYLRAGVAADYRSVAAWAAGASFFAASLATYWAYRRACRLPNQSGRPGSGGA